MSPRQLLPLLVLILVIILPIAVSAQAPPATTSDWCAPSIVSWSATFTLTGHGSLVWNGQLPVPGTADEKISGKINFVPINACSWQPSAFGFGDVSASVSITETDFSDPSCPVTFTTKGMGATGSGLTMGVADLIFLPTGVEGGPGLRFALGRSTLDSAHATHGLTFQCTGFTVTNPIPFYVGPANYNPILNFPLPAGGPQSFSVSTQFPADDQIGDPQLLWTLTLNLTPVSCPINFNIQPYAGLPPSSDGYPTSMNASFTPTDASGSVITLAAAATACGFDGFDWQQTILLNNGGVYAEDAPTVVLKTPPSFLDPPNGGYTYDFTCLYQLPTGQYFPPDCDPSGLRNKWLSMFQPNFAAANPYSFYYNPLDLGPAYDSSQDTGCAESYPPPAPGQLPTSCRVPISDASALNFFDKPNSNGPQGCMPTAACLSFTTQLVGICSTQPSPLCSAPSSAGSPSPYPSAPLFEWKWKSNYNPCPTGKQPCGKTTGGIYDVNVVSDPFPAVPGSGTGGVTITSINGVPQTPPSVACTVAPNTLWPPDGKPVEVTVSGTVTPGTQAIPAGGTTYAVIDEYGLVQPSGSFRPDAGGSYSFTVPLIAARNGNDLDGRTYKTSVIATDKIGNVGSCSSVVTVPHDQGN